MELDLSRVSADDFEADKFLRAALSGADQATVLRAIQDAKERASADLQRNVFRNYLSFVAISKDIAKLEDDMLVLRNLVQDLRSVAMESADEDYTDPAQDGPVRAKEFQDQAASSLASQTGRRQRSKNYFELVENLSRHLPPNPSRQTLREGSVVLDASAGSTRSAHPATLVLFTDALVVVSRKWPSVGAQKMTLEHCWGLTDVAVIDLKDGPDVTNTFKIIKHPDVFFCRFSTDDEKRSWLAAVKKATNDYLVARRAERESAAPAEKAEQRIAQPVAPEDVPARGTSLRVSTSKEAADPALSLAQWQWLSNLPDELDVWIAHREYDTATNESRRALDFFKSVGSDRAQLSDLRSKIQGRINELSTRIRRDLANPSSTKIVARRSIDLLCRLGQPERAREAFLKARESMIQHRVRQLNFDGDISAYISQLAIVFFTLLRNTCEWYNDAFKDPAMTSGFLKWVKLQIEHFAAVFRSQVFESEQPFSVISQCLQVAVEQAQSLRDVGLDLTFLLEHLFVPSSKDAVLDYTEREKDKILAALDKETFASVPLSEPDGSPIATEPGAKASATYMLFINTMSRFLSDVSLLGTITLYDTIIRCFMSLLSAFVNGIGARLATRSLSDSQTMIAIADGINAVDTLIPAASEQLSALFDRPILELEEARTSLLSTVREMITDYCDWRSRKLLSDQHYPFASVDYSSNASIPDSAKPSVPITRFVVSLHSVALAVVPPIDKHDVVSRCIENAMVTMTQQGWETNKGMRAFGFGGVQQLVLDIHFVLRICENYITDKTNDAANEVCERALRAYFAQKKEGPSGTLKSGEWYDNRIDDVLAAAETEFSAFLS